MCVYVSSTCITLSRPRPISKFFWQMTVVLHGYGFVFKIVYCQRQAISTQMIHFTRKGRKNCWLQLQLWQPKLPDLSLCETTCICISLSVALSPTLRTLVSSVNAPCLNTCSCSLPGPTMCYSMQKEAADSPHLVPAHMFQPAAENLKILMS